MAPSRGSFEGKCGWKENGKRTVQAERIGLRASTRAFCYASKHCIWDQWAWPDGVCCLLSWSCKFPSRKKEPNGRHGDISQFEEDNIKLQVSIGKWKLIVRSFRLSDQSCPVGGPQATESEPNRYFVRDGRDFRISGFDAAEQAPSISNCWAHWCSLLSVGDFGTNGVGWL